ncbi:MAG: hypothetical protein SGJ15_07300 [Bacteroidota bacterium]|nr:hypothetical protein [Bacteroidota bacterium]
MKEKLVLLILAIAINVNAQKITKIMYKDTSRWSKDGIMHKDLAHRLVIEGVYNGKDLLIKNSFGKNGIGFCISGLKVNGNYTTDEPYADMFKVDLSIHKLKIGDKVEIKVFYNDSCGPIKEPIIMNPGSIKPNDPSGNNVLVVEGKNYNSSLLFVNTRSGKGYGIKEVFVNGKKVEFINSDVVELSFFKLGIPYEAKLKIEFKYENGCDPFILNQEVINW